MAPLSRSFDLTSLDFNTLHEFSDDDGIGLVSGLNYSDSTIFGTAWHSGANNQGTLWSFDTGKGQFDKLHDFSGSDGQITRSTVAVSGEMIYGTAEDGGLFDVGTLWSFNTNTRQFQKLHDFRDNVDGVVPAMRVGMSDSTLFGTARGGANSDGVLWSFDLVGNTYEVLHDFDLPVDGRDHDTGVTVNGTLIYGTSSRGGAAPFGGTLWMYDTETDELLKLHDFLTDRSTGRHPRGVVVSGDTVFGTALLDGANLSGTVWSYAVPAQPQTGCSFWQSFACFVGSCREP